MAGKNTRRRLVTPEPELPLELVERNGEIASMMDVVSTAHCHGQKMPRALGDLRFHIHSLCPHYMPASDKRGVFGDGFAIVCASGRPGTAMLRGKICSKVCIVADPEMDKNVIKEEVAYANELIQIHGLEPVIAALKEKALQQGL